MVSHAVMLGDGSEGIMGVELVDYAGGDNRRETIARPFARVKPKLLTGQSLKDKQKKTRRVNPG